MSAYACHPAASAFVFSRVLPGAPPGCKVQQCPRETLEVAQCKNHRHWQHLSCSQAQDLNLLSLVYLRYLKQGQSWRSSSNKLQWKLQSRQPRDNPMEIDVNGRHAEICRSHQIPLVGAHSGNKNGIGDRIDCSVVSNRKISYLATCSQCLIQDAKSTEIIRHACDSAARFLSTG